MEDLWSLAAAWPAVTARPMGREAVLAEVARVGRGETAGLSEQPAMASERVCEDPALRVCSAQVVGQHTARQAQSPSGHNFF